MLSYINLYNYFYIFKNSLILPSFSSDNVIFLSSIQNRKNEIIKKQLLRKIKILDTKTNITTNYFFKAAFGGLNIDVKSLICCSIHIRKLGLFKYQFSPNTVKYKSKALFSTTPTNVFASDVKSKYVACVPLHSKEDIKSHPVIFSEVFGSLIYMLKNNYNNLEDKTNLNEEYKKWFVGFFDAEGCLRINARPNDRFEFKISIALHVDDFKVLEGIINKFKLNISIHYTSTRNACSISLGDKNVLLNTIIPLFDKYPLLTKKRYDYKL